MKTAQINVYEYSDLTDKAQANVITWLDQNPLDYENENGTFSYEYFYEMDKDYVTEHCDINGYLFSVDGRPLHQYII